VNADLLFFRLAALKSLDLAPAIPAFFALPAEKIAASYFHKSHVVRLYYQVETFNENGISERSEVVHTE